MDSLTHTVLGAVVGEALAGKKLGRKAMLWGALANNLPDIDVITGMWMNQADSLLAHRGFTHSILFALLVSPLLAYLFSRYNKKNTRMLYKDWLWIFLSGNLIHIGIDALTCYGTAWFEPFNHLRVSFNVLFVADPFFTISILISSVALLIAKKEKARRKWTQFGLVMGVLYIGYAMINKSHIHNYTKEELKTQNIPFNDFMTTPTPLNNWLWYLVAQSDSGYYIGYRSVFDSKKKIDFAYVPKNENLFNELPQDQHLLKLKRFAQGYYLADKDGDDIFFNDIRFGQLGGWDDNAASTKFVFRYGLSANANNDLVIQRGRMQAFSGREAINSLVKRIKGN